MLTTQLKLERIRQNLTFIYGEEKAQSLINEIEKRTALYEKKAELQKEWVDEQDVMLITYGDSIREAGKAPLETLRDFLQHHTDGEINAVHLLPFYPYSSDDGFSVIDYTAVDPNLGEWRHVEVLSEEYDLMFDAVINHISKESEWFQRYIKGDPAYRDYFIEADPDADYSSVTRPRALPLLTAFETNEGTRHVWTTFSDDQIDLNYKNEKVFLRILDILLYYVQKGARFLRLDAIGFLWKEIGTSCIHLEQTHRMVQVFRDVLDACAPGTIIITETNVPHRENVSYFGDGNNEAHMVYQFPLPPITLHSFQTGSARKLLEWADALESPAGRTAFFNFLASHDGIGLRPVEGILTEEEIQAMVERTSERGGFVSYKANGDGTQSPYELNINYLDALSVPDEDEERKAERFIAAQSILLSMMGVPGIYIHSLLGSQNDWQGVKETGRYRSINREKLDRAVLEKALADPHSLRQRIFGGMKKMIALRKRQKAFHPNASQNVQFVDDRLFAVVRTWDQAESIFVLINVSDANVPVRWDVRKLGWSGISRLTDIVSGRSCEILDDHLDLTVAPYQVLWLKPEKRS